MTLKALIFDVDGTLAETEELHRQAFNDAFDACGLAWYWSVDLYRDLLRVTGGKERIRAFLTRRPRSEQDRVSPLVGELHSLKTERYVALVKQGRFSLRPGVRRVIDEAKKAGLSLAIATTTSPENVEVLLDAVYPGGDDPFTVIAAGDEVAAKKPAPDIYLLALKRLGLNADACVAFEDSANGVRAARKAGLAVIATPGVYTIDDDLRDARCVLSDLGEADAPFTWRSGYRPRGTQLTLADIRLVLAKDHAQATH
jgi:HAD superfamily hydrolase (TIGR01509 family)